MLELRRIIELSSRIHTYLFIIYPFSALLFVLFLYFPATSEIISLITMAQMVLGWIIFLEAIWIIVGSLVLSIYSKVFIYAPMLKTIFRLVMYFGVSILLDVLNRVIERGFKYGI